MQRPDLKRLHLKRPYRKSPVVAHLGLGRLGGARALYARGGRVGHEGLEAARELLVDAVQRRVRLVAQRPGCWG